MADIPGALSKLNDIEISNEAPVTEALNNKYGANINELIDRVNSLQQQITDGFNEPRAVALYAESANMSGPGVETIIMQLEVTITDGDFVEYQAFDDRGSGSTVVLNSAFGDILTFKRDSTVIDQRNAAGSIPNIGMNFVRGSKIIDKPAPGTYTYTVTLDNSLALQGGLDLDFNGVKQGLTIKKFEG